MNTKKDFPIFKNYNNKYPLIYFDNASTTQKPQCVIDDIMNFYTTYNANVHRGAYSIAEKAAAKDILDHIEYLPPISVSNSVICLRLNF